jgi:hypothetical protein
MFLREAVVRRELDARTDVEELSLGATMLLDGVIAHQAEMGDRFDGAAVRGGLLALLAPVLGVSGEDAGL